MDEQTPERGASKRPFFKFYRDIFEILETDPQCLMLFTLIGGHAAFGEYKRRKRKVFELQPGQVLTSLRDLQKMTGWHNFKVLNVMNVLSEMGLISSEIFPRVGMRVTVTNICTMPPKEATDKLKTAGKWFLSDKRPRKPKAKGVSDRMHIPEIECIRPDALEQIECIGADALNGSECIRPDALTPSPSLLQREEEEREYLYKEREQNRSLCDLNFPDFLENESKEQEKPPIIEDSEDLRGAQMWLNTIKGKYPNSRLTETELIPIVKECRDIMSKIVGINSDDFGAVLGCVEAVGSPMQRNIVFKAPKGLLKPDLEGHTFFEEICDLLKTFVKKSERKFARERSRYYR